MLQSSTLVRFVCAASVSFSLIHILPAQQQTGTKPASHTQVVLLGTGNPAIDPDRSGPATAIVVNGTAYLVDMGAGVVRRAKEAAIERGISALDPVKLRVVFVTHLHSDHTVGYSDLLLTPWVVGRQEPLEVYGPRGMRAMSEHILEAYKDDFEARTKDDTSARGSSRDGHSVNAHEIKAGIVYKDANVTVTAFQTKHVMESFGYRFDTADRSIVISGDTTPTQATIDACHGCDVLIHEVMTQEFLTRHPGVREYSSQAHTNTTELATLAAQAKPHLLILYHATISWRPAVDSERSRPGELLEEMMSRYSGHVVVGRDLDVY